MVFAAGGIPTAVSVAVVIGLPPGPVPGKVCGPPPTSVLPQAVSSRRLLPALARAAARAVRQILIARPRDASGKFDLAATGGGAGNRAHPTANFGHHDARGRFATQLARFIDR